MGILCTCTQKATLSKLKSSSAECLLYLYNTTNDLSKLHGPVDKILSTSSSLLKTKRTLLPPSLLILKPFWALHRGLKVLPTASILSARLVKNSAAMINPCRRQSCLKQMSSPSFSERERQLHFLDKSSMLTHRLEQRKENVNTRRKKNKEKKLKSVSPPPKKEKKTTSPTCNVVTGGEIKPYEKERRFYYLRREGRPNFLRQRKKKKIKQNWFSEWNAKWIKSIFF